MLVELISPARRGATSRDARVLLAALAVCAAITAAALALSPAWRSPWCPPDQTPTFTSGFADLAQQLGAIMGSPTECEHGEIGSNDTFQQTTTGLAVYDWCTNTPRFTRGQEHWLLQPAGLLHWSDSDIPPAPLPVVRTPDVRHPCPA